MSINMMSSEESNIHESISYFQNKISELNAEISKQVVGQDYMVNRLLIGLFTSGHVLLEGVPGLAKTLTVNSLAQAINLDFKRIQFTPDLLPADVVGTMIYNQQQSAFEVKKGPVFANIVLADEINRAPAKVQAALLEAMQEKQVTIGEETYPLEKPFLVLATQNPVDQEGTYALPEAQVDRFMLKVFVDYPDKKSELEIMRRMSNTQFDAKIQPVLQKDDIFKIRDLVNNITVSESIEQYVIELIFSTRYPKEHGLDKIAPYISFGASPRASINLLRAAKAHAFISQRDYVIPEDIKAVAQDVLAHRIITNFEAEAEQISSSQIVDEILNYIPVN